MQAKNKESFQAITKTSSFDTLGIAKKYGTIIGFLLLIVIFSFLTPNFLTVSNLTMVLLQTSMLIIIALGPTVVIAAGGFDLSFGYICGLVGVLVAGMLVEGLGLIPSILLGISVGALFGLINGALVVFGLSDFVATLAIGSIAHGLNFYYSKGDPIFRGIPEQFKVIGQGKIGMIGYPVIIMIIFVLLMYIFMSQTTIGRHIYAVGGNQIAARLSGIRVSYIRILSFIISGTLAAVTAVILTSRLGSGQPTAGEGFLMDGLAAVFLGMTIFKEGEPHVIGTLIGSLIMAVLVNGLNLLGVQYYFQDILKGLILIGAVALTAAGAKKE